MKNEELGTKTIILHSSFLIPHSSFFIPHSGRIPHSKSVSLLSANVRIFNVYAQLRDPDYASSKGFVKWLADSPADVLCLQEFYNEPRRSKESGGVFQTER